MPKLPAEGRYITNNNMGVPGAGMLMTTAELAKCKISDDDRFTNDGITNHVPRQYFRFSLPRRPTWIKVNYEGHATRLDEQSGDVYTDFHVWLWLEAKWRNPGISHSSETDQILSFESTDPDEIASWIDDSGTLWTLSHAEGYNPYTCKMRLHTDQIWIECPGFKIAVVNNFFGQSFRAFDDGDAGKVSFERLDRTGADFSDPIQPFGDGSNSPSIECLPDGRLRAALIDGDGNLQKYQSYDDGETWALV